ncbi:hypothetical protein O9992_24480 [Vibrio lentus]|nr:hypothetical protein [Vibrio lentus]
MAQANHTMMIPHVWGSGIGIAASLQFIASLPSSLISLQPCREPMSPMTVFTPIRKKIRICDGIKMENGKVQISH